jgi:ubiquitin carboxyl-terminal hydrolase 7
LVLETNLNRPLIDVASDFHPWTDPVRQWTVFLETPNPQTPLVKIPDFNYDTDLMLFFKFYDPATEKIEYMGHMYVSIKSNLSDLIPELTRRAKLPAKTQVSYNRSSF